MATSKQESDNRFALQFDLHPLSHLDHFALLATQHYNLGDRGDWFFWFRRGLHGVHGRVYGIGLHYYDLHNWIPKRRVLVDTEYHLASLFFNMDSVMECFVYMMNALGNAIDASSFNDITDEKSLRAIGPHNVTGHKYRQPLDGYQKFFPNVQALWMKNKALIDLIMEQHDVSKHRFACSLSGSSRTDPPDGFFENLNVDDRDRFEFSPREEILLEDEPKKPLEQRSGSRAYEDAKKLEPIAKEFSSFITASAGWVVDDAQNYIKLRYYRFLDTASVVFDTDLDLFRDADCTLKRDDIKGLILGTEYVGHSVMRGEVMPITRFGYYQKGARIKEQPSPRDTKSVWYETWYVDPTDGQKKRAWQSSAEFVGEQ